MSSSSSELPKISSYPDELKKKINEYIKKKENATNSIEKEQLKAMRELKALVDSNLPTDSFKPKPELSAGRWTLGFTPSTFFTLMTEANEASKRLQPKASVQKSTSSTSIFIAALTETKAIPSAMARSSSAPTSLGSGMTSAPGITSPVVEPTIPATQTPSLSRYETLMGMNEIDSAANIKQQTHSKMKYDVTVTFDEKNENVTLKFDGGTIRKSNEARLDFEMASNIPHNVKSYADGNTTIIMHYTNLRSFLRPQDYSPTPLAPLPAPEAYLPTLGDEDDTLSETNRRSFSP
jgi:hypothetical protein